MKQNLCPMCLERYTSSEICLKCESWLRFKYKISKGESWKNNEEAKYLVDAYTQHFDEFGFTLGEEEFEEEEI